MADDLIGEQRQRIDEAVEHLAAAQREVDRALNELAVDTPRAQKKMVGDVLRDAMNELARAREALEQVRAAPPR